MPKAKKGKEKSAPIKKALVKKVAKKKVDDELKATEGFESGEAIESPDEESVVDEKPNVPVPHGTESSELEVDRRSVLAREYEREPNMFSDEKHCKACTHPQFMHYGSDKNWCNVKNCRCSEWSA